MAVDSPIRKDATDTPGSSQPGYLAGSKALDSLDKLLTSTESFFHPSNFGPWSMLVGNHLGVMRPISPPTVDHIFTSHRF